MHTLIGCVVGLHRGKMTCVVTKDDANTRESLGEFESTYVNPRLWLGFR